MARSHGARASRFIIAADLRTGSTLLGASLDRHPRIRCHGEIFHPRDLPDNQLGLADRHPLTAAALLRAALSDSSDLRAVGFRAMIFLPDRSYPWWPDAWSRLGELDGLKVIWLIRENRLAQYASLRIAERLGVFHPSPGNELPEPEGRPTITIDPRAFRRWVGERERLESLRRRQLAGKASIDIRYSELAGSWDRTMERVQRFLGVDALPLEPAKRKQETRPLHRVIENYDDVIAARPARTPARSRGG